MHPRRSTLAILINLFVAATFTLAFVPRASGVLPAQAAEAGAFHGTSKASLERLTNLVNASNAPGVNALGLTDTSYLSKLNSHLQDTVSAQLSGTDVVATATASGLRISDAQAVLMDIYVNGALDQAASRLTGMGMQVLATNNSLGDVVEGYLPVASVLPAARLDFTRAFMPVMGIDVGTGSVTSQGDAAHNGPAARALGATGAGVVVGVISDSINQAVSKVAGSQATGDLPANITIYSEAGSTDEGRAMAEIIYDTAPGITSMYFGTGMNGPAGKAAAINYFVAHGVKVIADDITNFGEPFFQDGMVAQAVDNAYNHGAAYFPDAGNYAKQSYEHTFIDEGSGDQNFNSGDGTNWLQTVAIVPNGGCINMALQWDDPWGHATHDFDFYLANTATLGLLAASEDNNLATGQPFEFLGWCNSTGSAVSVGDDIYDWGKYHGGNTSGAFLKTIAYGNFGTFSYAESPTNSQAIGPDAASAQGAMTVAAVRYNEAGLDNPELYSSRGPSITRYFNTSGSRLGSPIVRLKPNIAGADCVITSNNWGGGGFSGGIFCGTSAAAPSVAGIAALAFSANTGITVGQLYSIMENSANTIDCTLAGNPDADCGYGFSLADRVVRAALWGPPWVGSVSITSTRNVVAVGRPHVGAQVASYDGFPSGTLTFTSYVPMLFKNAFGGSYDSALYVQDVDPTPGHNAHVTVTYYDSAGNVSCTKPVDIIPSLASHGIWVPSESCLPVGWVGGAVVTSSDYSIVAVGRPHVGAEVMTYDGFSSGGLTSYLPMLFKNAFGGAYDSAFYVQNVDGTTGHTAHINVDYYATDGTHTCGPIVDTIPPLASHGVWVPSVSCLPVGWVGGVVVTSSDYNIVAVGRPHIGGQVTTYDGFTFGSATSYVPMLFKNAFGGSYDSALYVQNLSADSHATVTINYYDSAGALSCTRSGLDIAPYSSLGIWVPSESCLPVGWVGGAVVTSSFFDIVAVGRPHVGAQVTTYDGFTGGTAGMSAPMLFRNAFDGSYDSALYIQNTDSGGSAAVTLKFYDANGNLSCTHSDSIPALATLGFWVPSVTCSP